MADPMRIRAQVAGDKATVRVLMNHKMETGLRKDAGGKLVAAHFIQQLNVLHNGREVLSAQLGPSISKNPFLGFKFNGGAKGDRITVTWTDNMGDKRVDDAVIA